MLNGLGGLWLDRGEPERAKPLIERALAIREETFGPDYPLVAASLAKLAAAYGDLGDGAGALRLALRAEEVGRESLRLTARSLPERQALAYAAMRASGLSAALALAAGPLRGDAESCGCGWDALIRSRALALDEMATRHRAARAGTDPALAQLSTAHARAQQRLANLAVRGPDGSAADQYRALLDEARAEAEAAEQALLSASAAYRAESARHAIGLKEVAATLSTADVLVAYARFDPLRPSTARAGTAPGEASSYVAFVLRGANGQPVAVPLGDAAPIDSLVGAWRERCGQPPVAGEATSAEADCRQAGAALAQRIWSPLADLVAGAQRAFLVPDSELNLVNLAALPADATSYLIERGPLMHYLSAERDLVPPLSQDPLGQGLLAVGDPDYDAAWALAAAKPAASPFSPPAASPAAPPAAS